ncbi:MAG: hypothetical protein F4Y73_02650 [Gemmatimonadetes bacterium]|nr:hypothetical protein [Gemmatimonadota bacterium]
MLETRDRTLLLDSLRPPAGYRLRRAVGTSFTLDLMALLTAPLTFTFFDAHDDDGAPVTDPVTLLEALRRHAERITLFCQAGAIGVPNPNQMLLAFLEGSVVEVQPPRKSGIFHPKVWVLNFEAKGRPGVYRVLCLSRNLTFARAWDTCLRLEGDVTEAQGDFERNDPFADLLLELPKLATRPVSPELDSEFGRMAREIRRVDFELPRHFTDFHVHNFGLGDRREWPFPVGGRSLVVSPFLVRSTVEQLVRDHGLEVLISRPEAIGDVIRNAEREKLPRTFYVLSPAAGLNARDAEQEGKEGPGEPPSNQDRLELAGLHAKLFVFEKDGQARLFTGSANATSAAFEQNVEVLVELVGRRKDCGIDTLLGSDADPRHDTLRSLLQEYAPPDSIPEVDERQRAQEVLDRKAERLARLLAATRLTATAHNVDAEQRWDMTLSGELPEIPVAAEVRVWPATLPSREAQVIARRTTEARDSNNASDSAGAAIATFRGLSFEALTAFFALEVSLRDGPLTARQRFAVTAKLIGAPRDRKPGLLHSLLKDRRRVLQLLFLILMGEGADVSAFVQAARQDGTNSQSNVGGLGRAALLEALLRSLCHNPRRIDDAARLIADLRKTPEGRELLPKGLDEIWEPVWKAREALKS